MSEKWNKGNPRTQYIEVDKDIPEGDRRYRPRREFNPITLKWMRVADLRFPMVKIRATDGVAIFKDITYLNRLLQRTNAGREVLAAK